MTAALTATHDALRTRSTDDEILRRTVPAPSRGPRLEHRPPDGGRLTLDTKVASVWEGLHAAGAAECPVCRGRMERVGDIGLCSDCGSTLT